MEISVGDKVKLLQDYRQQKHAFGQFIIKADTKGTMQEEGMIRFNITENFLLDARVSSDKLEKLQG